MLIIAVMLVISGRFKQKRETFIADNKAETNASYEFTSGMVEVTRKFLTGLRRSRTATTTRKIDHGMSWDIMKMEQGLRQSLTVVLSRSAKNTVHADMEGLISDRRRSRW
jgi:hypothetical protein